MALLPTLVQIDANQQIGIDASKNIVVLGGGTARLSTAYEDAIASGMAFSAGTGLQRVNDAAVLNQCFSNPVGSGRDAYIVLRILGTNRKATDEPMRAGFITSPNPLAGATVVNPANLKTGGTASMMEFSWQRGETRLDRTPTVENPTGIIIPTGGKAYRIETPRLVQEGESFGFFIFGSTKDADLVSINYIWYEVETA